MILPTCLLGSTEINISRLGLGTVKLGRDQGVKYPDQFRIPDDKQAAELIALAKDLGINLIDTAPAYGTSEERLGKLLNGQRQDWVICTKVGEEFDNGESYFDFSPAHIRRSIERSLKRLNSDYLDMVLVHSDGNDETVIRQHGALDTLNDLKKQGLIRATGMSTKTVTGGILAAEHSDCVMVTYNLNHTEEQPVLDYCQQHNKGVLLKKVLASGHLPVQKNHQQNDDKITDAVTASFDFAFTHPAVNSAIVGTINPAHLRDNVQKAIASLRD